MNVLTHIDNNIKCNINLIDSDTFESFFREFKDGSHKSNYGGIYYFGLKMLYLLDFSVRIALWESNIKPSKLFIEDVLKYDFEEYFMSLKIYIKHEAEKEDTYNYISVVANMAWDKFVKMVLKGYLIYFT